MESYLQEREATYTNSPKLLLAVVDGSVGLDGVIIEMQGDSFHGVLIHKLWL